MGRFLTAIVMTLLLMCTKGQAQREHFVYLQTENMTPFYIKMNGKTISSTYSGYLILGKLKDSIYPIKLGMLGVDEVQDYGLKVDGRNAGYLVKKLGDRGWGIVDLQTNEEQVSMEWSSAIAAETARQEFMAAEQKRVADSIANASAAVAVADTAAANPAVAVAAAVVADTVAKSEAKPAADTASRIVESPKNEQQRLQDSIANVIAEKEKELKALQAMLAGTAGAAVVAGKNADSGKTANSAAEKTAGGLATGAAVAAGAGVVSAVTGDGNKDKSKAASDSTTQTNAPPPSADSSHANAAAVAVVADSVKAIAEPVVKADTATATVDSAGAKKATTDSVATAPKLQREPCVDVLGREEVEALINKTASIADGDEIIALYKKAFKEKCVSTSNLKKICNAMASDVTRYRILEAAYPHCLDFYAFPDLESLLKDSYYITKFKALVQQ
ncbi:MAG TPA: DUF4476 domain-containing protein [Phnomibacter sp.]|nr:DUF4476 domain-containing protein [Phnomibacter sp.]